MIFQTMFDARSIDPTPTFLPIPLADYKVMIVASEGKQANSGNGGYLELTLRVIEGQYANREVPYRLNLYHNNEQTVQIATKQLSALCHVTGVFQVMDSQQFHGIPFIATIGPQKSNPEYNEVKAVKDLTGNQPGRGASTGQAAQQQPNAQPQPNAAPPAWAQPQQPQQPQPTQPAPQGWGPPPATMQPPQQPAPQQSFQQPAGNAAPPWAQPAQPAPQQPQATQPAAPAPWQQQQPAAAPTAPPWAQK